MNHQLILSDSDKYDFIFSLNEGTAYEKQARKVGGGWAKVDLLQNKPASHRSGLDLQTRTISGKYLGADGMDTIGRVVEMKVNGGPFVLSDSQGYNLGRWKIMDINWTEDKVIDDGTAMVIPFTISLEEYAG